MRADYDNDKFYFHCIYSQKDVAKGLGAKWDATRQMWVLKNVSSFPSQILLQAIHLDLNYQEDDSVYDGPDIGDEHW